MLFCPSLRCKNPCVYYFLLFVCFQERFCNKAAQTQQELSKPIFSCKIYRRLSSKRSAGWKLWICKLDPNPTRINKLQPVHSIWKTRRFFRHRSLWWWSVKLLWKYLGSYKVTVVSYIIFRVLFVSFSYYGTITTAAFSFSLFWLWRHCFYRENFF